MSDSPDPVRVGFTLTYTLTVTNNGPATATGGVLVATLPASVTLVAVFPQAGVTCNGVVVCDYAPMPSGAARTVQVLVTPNTVGTVSYSGTVNAVQVDPNLGNNSASVNTTVTLTLREARETGMDVDLAFTSALGVARAEGHARGQVLVNGSALEGTDSEAPRVHRVRARAGENRIDAFLEPGAAEEGLWRFDFAGARPFVAGSLRVESGQVISLDSYSVVFDLSGAKGAPIRFTFELEP